mmetsp:Transcript_10102/g.37452  ORF Transcript_10102/g.37452 Transcript_10102/m.37452 type:complete len:230 (+) Transcript_10102:2395-3084(+)
MRRTASHPFTEGNAAMVRSVCMWQNGVISTGRGNPGPRPLHSLLSSTITTNFLAMTSTIFSLNRAPPPPLTSARSGSTSSAPSIATSNTEFSFSVHRGIFNDSACSLVRSLVGIATISVSSPDAIFCPSRSTAKYAVLPVPSPTTIPERTWSSTALYPTSFLSSSCEGDMARVVVLARGFLGWALDTERGTARRATEEHRRAADMMTVRRREWRGGNGNASRRQRSDCG